MTVEYLPNGDAVVTLGDEPHWTPRDAFAWAAFGERRFGDRLAVVVFPSCKWSRRWGGVPSAHLLAALNEIATGIPWQPADADLDAVDETRVREHAKEVIERNTGSISELAADLTDDLDRLRLAFLEFRTGREDVMSAVRQGRLHVWARRAHGPGQPDYQATPERLHTRLFTHDIDSPEQRDVGEDGWVQGRGDYQGPWWDQARFDADVLQELWPARPPSAGISDYVRSPQPFPTAERIASWAAVTWRAFGTTETPEHIQAHRSFDHGTDRLPDETRADFAMRRDEHRRFDVAELEIMNLLGTGRITAVGLPPARSKSGEYLGQPSKAHEAIPGVAFLNPQLAFNAMSDLVVRASTMERVAPPAKLRGTDADPGLPIYYDVLIKSEELTTAWKVDACAETSGSRADQSQPVTKLKGPALSANKRLHASKSIYSDALLGAWFIIRVKGWDTTQPYPSEKADLEAALAHFERVPRDPFRAIRRAKTPAEWHKPGPRGPRV